MKPIFRAARQSRIFQDVVEQIQEAIIDGRLTAGDKLPAERELKEMLQTSRSTLREALRVLEQKGLIEIKLGTGGGAVVRSLTSDQVAESLDLLIRSQKVSLNHLAEFRESIEGNVVALAAERICREDVEQLNQLLDQAGDCVEHGTDELEEFLRVDRELHMLLAKITRNPVYISILKTVHDNIHRYYERFLTMDDREMRENYIDLREIVQTVTQGQTEKARKLAQSHVWRFTRYMKRQAQTIAPGQVEP